MSWSRVKAEIGKTGENDAMATVLQTVGIIKDKSTSLSIEDGEKLTAVATGGIVVAEEEGEPTVSVKMRVMEMDVATETLLTGAVAGSDKLTVKSNVVNGNYSLKLTPKNIGAIGIKARKTHVSFRPGYSEEERQYVDLTFKILACEDGELYEKFKVKAEDWTAGGVGA